MSAAPRPERYLPDWPFPPYAHVPGQTPHPEKPGGHLYGHERKVSSVLNPNHVWSSRDYLYAVDLFNYGYAWEAHVYWEMLWNQAGRQGAVADMLKGLIKMAAAKVKLSVDSVEAAQGHTLRAQELFGLIEGQGHTEFLGLRLSGLAQENFLVLEQH